MDISLFKAINATECAFEETPELQLGTPKIVFLAGWVAGYRAAVEIVAAWNHRTPDALIFQPDADTNLEEVND